MGPTATVTKREKTRTRRKVAVIDCDIHNIPRSDQDLYKYLPERWRRYHQMIGLRGHYGSYYPRAVRNAARLDSWPPSGFPPGSDLAFMREQLLDEWEMDYGILNCLFPAGGQVNLEYGAALATAINDWQIAEWTDLEPRLRASILLPYEDGDLAAAEIHRCAGQPGFVQILLTARTSEPLGRRKYWKIYEAAVQHDLPIGIHFGGVGGGPITGAGWPSHYIEDHCGMPQTFQAQIISMVCEGIFERFPTLKIVIIEGGFAWVPPMRWRLDRAWEKLREEVPYLKKPPSEYIDKHFWFTTQPMEEPPNPKYFLQLLDQFDGYNKLMFATDYPHWDFDAPDQAIPVDLPLEQKRKIMAENARTLYRL